MNPGELRNPISILNYELKEEVYRFKEERRVFSKIESKAKKNYFSKFGIASSEFLEATIRNIKGFDKNKAIKFRGNHYLISSIEDIDYRKRFLKFIMVKQNLYICEAFRNVKDKDIFNRPTQNLSSIYKFEAYLIEKYSSFNEEKVSTTNNYTMILMTPKIINLKPGDLVEINEVKYKVEIIHTLDDYFNEYEITIKQDI